jgi:hypothetical protein
METKEQEKIVPLFEDMNEHDISDIAYNIALEHQKNKQQFDIENKNGKNEKYQ